MYLIPMGLLLQTGGDISAAHAESLTWAGYGRSLVPVILGNIVGGSGLVALVYYVIYRHGRDRGNKSRNGK
ncbi:MAG: hypothetical protein A2W18_08945 [Candidatus Muproteobacteria bacterium RBG_16_60_9]|uniref:Formate transporter n=1 Tax=Candidatus Muproteobacteria bacterium RBG_16_60_9 TaxID=1817755 RepID=A0A1F6V3Q4_9PROT|nr:MAG: hypothetical protein A2W18_08945 [Candidatus Muproteobacteria bacterium RBG_16_60_9]